MIIIQGLTGVTQKADIQIQKSISRILVVKTGTATAIGTELISYGTKGAGVETIGANRQKVRDLALASQFGNGYMLQAVVAGGLVKCSFPIALNRGVGLAFNNQEYLSVNLEALEAGATYDIYGFESPVKGREMHKYQNDFIPAGDATSKQYNLGANSVLLAIKNNGALNKIDLVANNGNQVSYLPEELAFMAREMNGTTYGPDKLIEDDDDTIVNQVVGGSSEEYYFIPTENYKSFEVHTNSGLQLSFNTVNGFGF